MSTFEFFPFLTSSDSIELTLSTPKYEYRLASDGSIILYEDEDESISVNGLVNIPDGLIDGVLHPSEHINPPVKTVLTRRSIESRKRDLIELIGGNTYNESLEFRRNEWRGVVEVQALLVRTSDNSNLPETYACKKGALLAWSPPRRILFDEPRVPPGDYLNIKWIDFRTSAPWLQRQQDNLFAMDTSQEVPTILLNQGVPNLYQVLRSRATSGKVAQIRDATFNVIVHQVWSSLLGEGLVSLFQLVHNGEEEDVNLSLDQLPEWQKRILVHWAPKLYSEEHADESLSKLISNLRLENWQRDLFYMRVPEAIQKQYQTWKGFQGLVKGVDSI